MISRQKANRIPRAPKAVHIPEGNFLDNIHLDLPASFLLQTEWLKSVPKRSVRRSAFVNKSDWILHVLLKRLGCHDAIVNTGIISGWFHEFHEYWSGCLGGRPLALAEFFMVLYDYRKRFHAYEPKGWSDPSRHVSNYQAPVNLYSTLAFVYRQALNPNRFPELSRFLRPAMRILEFGCSLAPMYRTWQRFYNHIDCQWVLADIPSYPFHCARHIYAEDLEARTCVITEDLFDAPLENVSGSFDLIIVQEVFEHLHKPLHIARYLFDRLNADGLFFFDYIKSDAHGLDTPAGLTEREKTLGFLSKVLRPVFGNWRNAEQSVGPCVGQK